MWEHGPAGWIIVVMFGNETLAFETAPTRQAMEAGVDLVWRGLLASGLGKSAANSKALAAMSESGSDAHGKSLEMPRMSETMETLETLKTPKTPETYAEISEQNRPGAATQGPRRIEDPFSPHMPFRHPEPSFEFDTESSDPPPRRRLH